MGFSCPHCSTQIGLTLDISRAPSYDLKITNAEERKERQYHPFDGKNPFVDIHLDFPVVFGGYQQGLTPFLAAIQRIGKVTGDMTKAFGLFQYFSQQMKQLNDFSDRSDEVRTAIKLYFGKNKQLFKRRVEQLIDEDLGASVLPQDVNAALYRLVSRLFRPLIHADAIQDFVEELTKRLFALSDSKHEPFNAFIDHIVSTGFLGNIQRDCLEIYPHIYDAEIALRPAIYLDLIIGADGVLPDGQTISGRVAAKDFQAYKDLYKDLCEIFGRQLILVAGMNNLEHRGNHDAFAPNKDGQALSSLDKFADKTLSDKFKYLDDCWFIVDRSVINTGIRNAIAHHITEYDEHAQMITYFPEKEGVRQEKSQSMSFLAFMRLILQLFREIHYLSHLIKCLLYFNILMRSAK